MQKTGKYYWLTVICYLTFTLGVIPIILCTGWISRSIWGIWAGTVICGFSHGIGGTSSLVALSTSPSSTPVLLPRSIIGRVHPCSL